MFKLEILFYPAIFTAYIFFKVSNTIHVYAQLPITKLLKHNLKCTVSFRTTKQSKILNIYVTKKSISCETLCIRQLLHYTKSIRGVV